MGQIDIFKVNTLVIQSVYSNIEASRESLNVGKGYSSYMRFDLSSISLLCRVIKARLTLFKIPIKPSGDNCVEWEYEVAPLLDYVNVYSNYYASPKVDKRWAVSFKNDENISYIVVDMTQMVNQWLIGGIENKGILIDANHCSNLLRFASPEYEVRSMRPFLSVTYETKEGEIPAVHPSSIVLPSKVAILR